MSGVHGVRLSLVNGFGLTAGSVPVVMARSSQRVLAFIGLKGGHTTRDHLCAALWPESSHQRASGNLRSVLWRLPPPVRRVVTAESDEVRFAPDVSCDVTQVVSLMRDLVEGADPPASATALELLQHDLLPSWYDDWVLFERERLRQLRIHALESLAATLTRKGRFAEAIDAALHAICAEPLRESAHCRLIEAHLAEGNVNEAIAQYERYRALLDEALGVPPSPGLRALLHGRCPARAL